MANPKVLVDTSGFYALLVRNDSMHAEAARWLTAFTRGGQHAFTTDYVVDKTATLLLARGFQHLLQPFFRMLDESEALSMVYVDEARFIQSRNHFLKHLDQEYSFTDCTSMLLMKEFGVKAALTKDEHFAKAGFKALLAGKR